MKKQAVYFVSLGCPKNRVDTEVMLGLSDRAGFTIARAPEDADAIVVNTCGFIGEAKEESIDTILEMARYKSEGRAKRLVVTGCLTQRYSGDLQRDLPEVDHFLGSGDVDKIVGALRGEAPRDGVSMDPAYLYDDVTPRLQSLPAYTAYVKIAEGCDRPCSFCIIPKLRGGQRSRSADSVEREVRELVARGAVEINLVAQDLTTYGKDLDGELQLASLVERLARVDGLRWLRLHYAYPTATTDQLLDAIASEPRVAKYIDMPLQHVDDQMLKYMRRGHVGKTSRALVDKIRARIPGVTLRTTFIVGHPGETEAAFGRLVDFVREAEFDRVGVFTYSNEDGTHAAKLAAELGAVAPQGNGAAPPRAHARAARHLAQEDEGDGRSRARRARRGTERRVGVPVERAPRRAGARDRRRRLPRARRRCQGAAPGRGRLRARDRLRRLRSGGDD